MNWVVTVPLWRQGKGVPIAERIEQLEQFRALTGKTVQRFATEDEATSAAYLWSQVLGFSVEAKFRPPLPTEDNQP
ncbi:hypothetical protein CN233_18750 [Sinorhizobium meliloti]|uniref:hypothetical protein n=1 Tax=Rhizobium meliloti TaxID=382 RepID=UPI000FDC2D27|nr:hypothetical protein [Sinorhizobium meliloti]RVG29512.1 hypothetical protein CN233_18750 [Sinorhizobium meliloti]